MLTVEQMLMAQSGKAAGGPRPLYAWGMNNLGSVGDNSTISRSSPVQIGTSLWTAVSVMKFPLGTDRTGGTLSWGIRADNTLWSWGTNASLSAWPDYVTNVCSWTAVHAGGNWSGVRTDGTAWFAGTGNRGQLGNNAYGSTTSPVLVSNGYTDWCRVWAWGTRGFGLRTNGYLYGWGCGYCGSTGRCLTTNTPTPGRAVIAAGTICQAGFNYLDQRAQFAIGTNGGMWAWGPNCQGQTGVGLCNTSSLAVPTRIGTSAWSMVASSGFTGAAIRQDGTLWSWGANDGGFTLGRPGATTSCSPVQVGTVNTWVELFATSQYGFFARRSNGTIWAWGCNYQGRLGFGDCTGRSEPTQIGTLTWDRITTTIGNMQAIRSGQMWMWGRGYSASWGDCQNQITPVQISASGYSDNCCLHLGGQTSIRDNQIAYVWAERALQVGYPTCIYSPVVVGGTQFGSSSSPVQVASGSWTCISSAFGGVLALKTGGTLWGWGTNQFSRLGLNNTFTGPVLSPTQVGSGTWQQICINKFNSAGINSAGNLFVWGGPSPIFTGDNTTALQSWTVVSFGDAGGTSTAGSGIFAIRDNGTLWAWGNNAYGALGHNNTVSYSSPVQVGTCLWKSVYAACNKTAAIRQDGTLWVWGTNDNGALGLNDSIARRSSPTQIGTSIWSAVSIGGCAGMAIRQDRTLWTWGVNLSGAMGLNSTLSTSSPVQVGTSLWTAVSTNNTSGIPSTGAIRCDGALFTWGCNAQNQLGDNTTINRSSPVQISAGNTFCFIKMSNWCGAAAIRCDGGLMTWGNNRYGRLGLGSTLGATVPNQVGASAWSMVTIVQCGAVMLAIRQDGTLWSWGCAQPPFGRGATYAAVCSPVQVGTSSWTFLARGGSASGSNMNAIRQGGTLFWWGCSGTGGASGTGVANITCRSPVAVGGNFLGSNSPTQVGTSTWSAVALTFDGCAILALRQDRTLWSWGCNFCGLLGLNNNTITSSPQQIGSSSWAQIKAYSCAVSAIRCDGTLWGWGGQSVGTPTIGDNSTIARSSPVQIGTSLWQTVDVSKSTVGAIRQDKTLWTWGTNICGALGNNTTVNRSSPTQVGTSCWTAIAMGGSVSACYSSLGLLDA